jgi:hypothetical protein
LAARVALHNFSIWLNEQLGRPGWPSLTCSDGDLETHTKRLRRLLVSSAHYILGPFGHDSDLRRHGEKIASRGAKNAKKRAVVAVARKLAVLLHSLWISAELYEPLRNAHRSGGLAA